VDIDSRNGGRESFARLEEELGSLPQTGPFELTGVDSEGKRGAHIYFRNPGIKGNINKLAPGVEIKVNGYVVCAPSTHATGVQYEWKGGPDQPLPELPEAWLRVIKGHGHAIEKAPSNIVDDTSLDIDTNIKLARAAVQELPASVSGDGGHDAAWLAAVTVVRGFCLPEAEAFTVFNEQFNSRCDPPWSQREIVHKLKQAATRSNKPWGYLLPVPTTVVTVSEEMSNVLEQALATEKSGSTPTRTRVSTGAPAKDPRLTHNEKGQLIKHVENLRVIFESDPNLRGRFAYNTRSETFLFKPMDDAEPRTFLDTDIVAMRTYLVREYGVQFGKEDTRDMMEQAAREQQFDPVEDELRSYRWDGVERLGSWLVDYCKAEDTPLNREIGKVWLKGAVARALNPGCQFDYCLVLEGRQGVGKTTTLRILGGQGYIDSQLELGGTQKHSDVTRELYLSGAWIVELGELDALKGQFKRDSAIKQFITQSKDAIRMMYARYQIIKPRSFVLAGTTNSHTYLTDTQNRRWLPVRVGQLDRAALERDRDQLLAEAVYDWEENPSLFIGDQFGMELNEIQDSRREVRPDEEAAIAFLGSRSVVQMKDVYDVTGTKWDRRGGRYAMLLEKEGWVRARGRTGRYWVASGIVDRGPAEIDTIYGEEQAKFMAEMGKKDV
jgi:predicted P-loop ATPase